MTLLQNDPVTQLAFSVYENKGVFAILLGSGLSRSAEIPTGWEITLDLVRRVATAQGVEEQSDWAKWYREKTGQEPNYSVLLEEIATSPDERRAILHRYIEPDAQDREEGRKVPTKAHHAIAQLVRSGHIRVIITTNFDRLMENALREQGVEPTVVASADALSGAEPLTHSRCYLLKLHGDYKDARILNTDQELSAYPESYDRLLDRILDEHGLVICGWSGEWDHALRAAFLRTPNRRYPVYWSARGSLGTGASELAAHRSAKTIPISGADEFFETLQQRVEILEQSQRQNPLSVELLVNSAKRYLAKPEYRIQLDELFSQETERLLARLDDNQFAPHGQWNQEEFRSRVQRYEALTEPLARMAGVLGRWGDGSELPLMLDILKGIYRQAEKIGNGLTVWLGLRSYPAVLVFTAYGVGLTRSQRWKTLHELLVASWPREYHEPRRVVSVLFLWAWKGEQQDVWKQLDGLDRRKTALSDHLHDVMSAWRSSFAGISSDFELTFERFETLAALAFLEENDEASLEQAVASTPHGLFARMPVGRAGWHESSATGLIQELQSEATILDLLNAGFAKNSRRFLEIFVESFKRYASKMSW
ncbi:SIR2 family protein [Burkholderia gladioli]|uniref:SIR2 family protein n=1 Tax=Burkholderia gladioli TaxID=28095 RepID=UPI001C264620|nr:SIR2 family protein [Burkholderia gladioli]MBU9379014.1 SIR2 family protein [Burkholderia gladioli]